MVGKDWVVVMSKGTKATLSALNAALVRIDQTCGILAPILAPIAHSVGVEPVQFGVIFLVGASIGFITPPYGLNLYVASGVTGVPYFRLLRYSSMYLIALIAVWVAVAMTPDLALWLLPAR